MRENTTEMAKVTKELSGAVENMGKPKETPPSPAIGTSHLESTKPEDLRPTTGDRTPTPTIGKEVDFRDRVK